MTSPSAATSGLSIFGVRIRVHASWLIMALFIAWSLASGALPSLYGGLPKPSYWGVAVLIVLGIAVSIVLHELAHTLVGRAMGVSIRRITLFLFGGAAELAEEPKRPAAELAMAVAGPAFSVVFSLVLAAAAGAVQSAGGPAEAVVALGYLATLNLVLAAFNMVPAFPLDGGRVLRALVWMATGDLAKATRIAARAGEILAMALVGLGVFALFTTGAATGLWWILIGLFLHAAARGARLDQEARQVFAGHAIAEFMTPDVEAVPSRLTLDRFVDERLLGSRHGLYPVEQDGRWIGVVTPEDVLNAPRRTWSTLTVEQICRPASETPSASLLEDAAQVMERMGRLKAPRMPVVKGGEVVGVVTLQDLARSLEFWRRFGRGAS